MNNMSRMEYAEKIMRYLRSELMIKSKDMVNMNIKSSHTDVVTQYDQMIETMLCNEIKKEYPQDVFFTEEETENNVGEHMWIIDPIDGTVNFAVQNYGYAISVAYYENFQEVFGLVYDVTRNIMYRGIKGQGSYKDNMELVPLGDEYDLSKELFDVSYPAIKNLKKHYAMDFSKIDGLFLGHRACGSAALAICAVAAQTLGIYASFKLCIWDYAAAKIILENVGGACCNINTDEFPLDDVKRPHIVAKNQKMLDEIITQLQ